MDGTSLTPEQEKLNALQQLLPEAFSEGKIDWEKLKATLGEDINFSNERYVLNWAGKSEAFKVLQLPSSKTLVPAKEESINFDDSNNIFIEGENLEVLKVLQKSYFGKVKMIYIDPPYNTGNDSFIYPDKFSESKAEYEKRVGDKDDEGYMTKDGMFRKNSRENGQYHSNWLNMMMPRLYLAKNLLRQDGVIFVSIDDNEVHNLRLLMNEIFGEENFVAEIVWQKKTGAGAKTKGFITLHEYVLCYAKNFAHDWNIEIPYSDKTRAMYNKRDEHFDKLGSFATWPLDTTSMGERKNLRFPIMYHNKEIWPKKQWLWSKEKVEKAQKENKLVFNFNEKEGTYSIRFKGYLKDDDGQERRGKPLSVTTGPYTQEGTKDFENVFNERDIFPFPKPVSLIKQLLNVYINGKLTSDDIFLDFFGGSGTTAQAVLELNRDGGRRKFILVQLPELVDEKSEAFKAGYKTIADISKERIRRAAKKIQEEINTDIVKITSEIKKLEGELPTEETLTEIENFKDKIEKLKVQDLGFKSLKLSDSNFKQWQQIEGHNAEALAGQIKLFIDPVSESATIENMVYELVLKSGKDLNSNIEKKDSFYSINDNELVLMLEKATKDIIDTVIASKPIKVIALDKLFKGNDQLKTNTVLQMKDAGIEFKTV